MRRRPQLFPVNVWPPMVDALTLALAAFVVLMVLAAAAQRGLLQRLRDREGELARLRDDKERIERRLRAIAPAGSIEVEEGKVILQGEVLFDSGSDELTAPGRAAIARMAPPLAELLRAEPGQMVLVGGHTDDVPIRNARFASNWELSTARAVEVVKFMQSNGVDPRHLGAAGYSEFDPVAPNGDEPGRARNRRIEIVVMPAAGDLLSPDEAARALQGARPER